jgi:thymidylate synthase (FAD)
MRIEVLDHGYVELVETWGSDQRIIEAARMSTQKGFLGWDPGPCPSCRDGVIQKNDHDSFPCPDCEGTGKIRGDVKLLRFLWGAKHSTPFEFGGLVIEVQAPIFVFREWHRHRTQSYNEMSARYAPLPDQNYIPTVERLLINSKKNKQAGTAAGAEELTVAGAEWFRATLAAEYRNQETLYQAALKSGVPKELARVVLPVGRYSKMRASTCLRNWLAFMTLRSTATAPDAQWEIRQFADAVGEIIAEQFPRTWELFDSEHAA